MFRALSVLLLAGGIVSADELADRKIIDTVVKSLLDPQVQSDPERIAELTTADFRDLDSLPARTIWCELDCERFNVSSIRFVSAEVAEVNGETTRNTFTVSRWVMTLKRDGSAWRLSSVASVEASPH
jgi:hypothetical protein